MALTLRGQTEEEGVKERVNPMALVGDININSLNSLNNNNNKRIIRHIPTTGGIQ